MKRLYYILPLVVVAVLGGFFAVGLTLNSRDLPSVLINQQAPPFDLPPLKGSDRGFKYDDLLGQVSLVNVFGSWCIACKIEHPVLMKVKSKNMVPLHGIDWREKNRDDGPNWLKRKGNPYNLVGDDPVSKAAIAFGVTGAPETFIIDYKGVIRYKLIGPMTEKIWEDTFVPIIEELRRVQTEELIAKEKEKGGA